MDIEIESGGKLLIAAGRILLFRVVLTDPNTQNRDVAYSGPVLSKAIEIARSPVTTGETVTIEMEGWR